MTRHQMVGLLLSQDANAWGVELGLSDGVGGTIADRSPALGMPGVQVDGNDVIAVI